MDEYIIENIVYFFYLSELQQLVDYLSQRKIICNHLLTL